MTRSLAIAGVLFFAVFVGGYALQDSLFDSSDERGDSLVHNKSSDAAVGVEQAIDAGVESPELRVRTIKGKVERRNNAGTWIPHVSGERVPMHDAIRTDINAVAVVELGGSELVLPAESKLTIEENTGMITGLRLSYGRATVRVSRGENIQIRFDGSDSKASSSDAHFSTQNTGHGHVTLTTEDGVVELSAGGESVSIPAGFQSVVAPKQTPSEPTKIPSSLFLKVRRPRTKVRTRNVVVTGTTTPGAVVVIKEVSGHADAKGAFSLSVPLREGDNALEVIATDVLGRRGSRKLRTILVDSKAPVVNSDVSW